jgi:hypothetical protein
VPCAVISFEIERVRRALQPSSEPLAQLEMWLRCVCGLSFRSDVLHHALTSIFARFGIRTFRPSHGEPYAQL